MCVTSALSFALPLSLSRGSIGREASLRQATDPLLSARFCLPTCPQVRKEDQIRINEFGRNNAALHELRDAKKSLQVRVERLSSWTPQSAAVSICAPSSIPVRHQRLRRSLSQDKLDTLDDANTELMMGEGDNVECVPSSVTRTARAAAVPLPLLP